MSWDSPDLCDSGIDKTLERLVEDICDKLDEGNGYGSLVIDSISNSLSLMIKNKSEPFENLVNAVQNHVEEVKCSLENDNDDSYCDDCSNYAGQIEDLEVQIEDLEANVEELKERPTLVWEGRTLEHRRENVFIDTTTGDAFELKPSTELVSICAY